MRAFVAHYAKGSYALQREQAADVIPASPRRREAVPLVRLLPSVLLATFGRCLVLCRDVFS